jgi:prepilin-type N-terminal cleavage/methylation domain-containing protein/prepilin-type processing-associated H-X9-DG protein
MSCQAILRRDAPLFAFTQESKRISCRLTSTDYMTNNRSPAFTIIEMIIVLAVIAVMMSFVYPMYTGATERAKATKDMSNLRQIAIAVQTYLNDNDQILPATTTWPGTSATPVLYSKYIATRKVFQSPFDKRTPAETDTAPVSYSINTNMYVKLGTNPNILKVVSPSSTFLMAPKYTGNPGSSASWTGTTTSAPDLPVGAPAETKGTHSNGRQINVLFCDWHTETLTFGPGTTPGTFQDWQSVPLGVKHWDPTQ